jgi:hypothetical protein
MSGVFHGCLQTLQDRHQEGRTADDWMLSIIAPEERLLKFDAWVRRQLTQRLKWPGTERQQRKMIEQCRVKLERLVVDLWRRGWMLDGQKLSRHILSCLDDIAAAQAAGRVKDFWPFFCRVVDRYVGINSEEIQAEARTMAGARPIGSIISQLGSVHPSTLISVPGAPTLPELVVQRREETLREKLSRRRKAEAAEAAGKEQLPLF